MKNNIEYSSKGLTLVRTFSGDVTIETLVSSLKHMLGNEMLNHGLIGIISDFTKANFLLDKDGLLVLKGMFIEHNVILGELRFAQIINTPKIAQTMLFEDENKDVKTRSFSTMEAAENWMNSFK